MSAREEILDALSRVRERREAVEPPGRFGGWRPDPPPRFSGYRRASGEGGRTTKDDALAQSLEAESGISNQSRIADAVDEETRKAKL